MKCYQCGRAFRRYPGWGLMLFPSCECVAKLRQVRVEGRKRDCGVTFTRRHSSGRMMYGCLWAGPRQVLP